MKEIRNERTLYPYLSLIEYPRDLRKLLPEQLPKVAEELRDFIISETSHNPGHLGASLGTVELTVALHYVFNTPEDKLIWDVGHQAYGHKILTGRKLEFDTNRKYNGISGFPKMSESKYDAFGTGHSSTSISAALGMAIAAKLDGNETRQHIAVIGDGSMTGGEAFEGLNHAAATNANILVILNDNGIAIDAATGGLHSYLTDMATSRAYNKLKNRIWAFLSNEKTPRTHTRNLFQKLKNSLKIFFSPQTTLFESLGFRYFGPVDGHNVERLVKILADLKNIPGPKLLHVVTVKGKGLKPAEENQTKYHAPGVFDSQTGEIIEDEEAKKFPKFQEIFGHTIIELAEKNDKVVGVSPAMLSGCSLDMLQKKMPERVFDVGIAEQHAVTFSAGLAAEGYRPFCNIYSTFLQRAYDQIIHDVALNNLPVIFCIDRGGLVGEDGATHHGIFDLAFMRTVPGMVVTAPMSNSHLRNLMYTALSQQAPFSIRYPRGRSGEIVWKTPLKKMPIGKGRKLLSGLDLAIISIGYIGNNVMKAIRSIQNEGISVSVYDMIFLKPIDEDLLHDACEHHSKIITIEDGTVIGGLGDAVADFITENNYQVELMKLGIDDYFVEQGTIAELQRECGINPPGIVKAVKQFMRE